MSSSNPTASGVTSANRRAAHLANALAVDPSRRGFLKGAGTLAGVFILGAYVPFKGDHVPFRSAPVEDPVPVPQAAFDPNVFLKIGADDSVTIISKHFEMGQGVTTGLATLIADELEADWSKVRFEFAPADARLYNNLLFGPVMGTGGSSSMAESWVQMRQRRPRNGACQRLKSKCRRVWSVTCAPGEKPPSASWRLTLCMYPYRRKSRSNRPRLGS
jgi:isoquinoline 1-oxidoreductase beta subunit